MSTRALPSTPRTSRAVTTFGAVALAALLSSLVARDADAQEIVPPAPRQGYYLAFSASSALNVNSSTEDDVDAIYGTFFQGRLGEMVTDWLGFGLQFGGGAGAGGSWESAYGGLMLDAQFVLPALPALSAHIGAGAGGISITDTEAVDQDVLKGTGGAYYAVGLAYDLFPFYDKGSGGFSVVPHVQAHYMPGNIVNAWFFVAGLELTWWTGLDRDKLDLPYEEQYQRGDQ